MSNRYLIGIGPGKSGSTWLYSFLKSSSQICCSKVKETGYFSTGGQVVESDYLEKFFPDTQSKNIFCEVSNTYIFDPSVPRQLAKLGSSVDLIAVLRDPVDRAISHVHQLIRNGERFDSFESALHQRPDILARGLYVNYLNNYTELPSHVTLHIFSFKEMATAEGEFKKRLIDTLVLDATSFTDFKAKKFSRTVPRSRTLAGLVKRTAILLRHLGFTTIIQRVKDSFIPQLLYAPATRDRELTPQRETLIFMRKFFYLSDLELSRQWGVDTSEWQSQASDA